jgi:hypothetical protein
MVGRHLSGMQDGQHTGLLAVAEKSPAIVPSRVLRNRNNPHFFCIFLVELCVRYRA